MNLYNCKTDKAAASYGQQQYIMTKFDADLNPVEGSTYLLTEINCVCPQGHKSTCRHRRMLPIFLASQRQDTGWFLCFEDSTWHTWDKATGEAFKTELGLSNDEVAPNPEPAPAPEPLKPTTLVKPMSHNEPIRRRI